MKNFIYLVFVYFVVSITPALSVTVQSGRYFDQQKEFPNYLLPEKFRNSAYGEIPKDTISEVQTSLEKAVYSMLRRMVIPVVPDGGGQPEKVRYYEYLNKELSKIDPSVELLPTGGTVRSALSEIYNELYEAYQINPKADSSEILKQIAGRTEDIPAGRILGVGSDLDTLFKVSENSKVDLISKRAKSITDSSIEAFGGAESSETMRRVFFTRGDVKEYKEQISRAEGQGGSELDHLSLSMKSGQFVEPLNGRSKTPIVSDFIQGVIRYLPPESSSAVEEQAKTVIRGPRALTELPFLSIHSDDKKFFISEINQVRKQIKEGKLPSENALEQFNKLTRNSRYSGAHNRFYRAKDDSVEAAFLKLAEDAGGDGTGRKILIPEFVDEFPLTSSRRPLNGLPEEVLMKGETFIKDFTNKGTLYHGTNLSSGIGILRGGMHVSNNVQGLASGAGRGGYTTKHLAVAAPYAGQNGIVLTLKVNSQNLDKLNIVNISDPSVVAKLASFESKANLERRDFYEYLAREHGIDAIVVDNQGVVLVQNTSIFGLTKSYDELLQTYLNNFNNKKLPLEERLSAGVIYETFTAFQKTGTNLKSASLEWDALLRQALKPLKLPYKALRESATKQLAAISAIGKLKEAGVPVNKEWETLSRDALTNLISLDKKLERGDLNRYVVARIIAEKIDDLKNQPELIDDIEKLLTKSSSDFREGFTAGLGYQNDGPELFRFVRKLSGDSDALIRKNSLAVLSQTERDLTGEGARIVVQALKDKNSSVRESAAEALEYINYGKERDWIFSELKDHLSKEKDEKFRKLMIDKLEWSSRKSDFKNIQEELLKVIKSPRAQDCGDLFIKISH